MLGFCDYSSEATRPKSVKKRTADKAVRNLSCCCINHQYHYHQNHYHQNHYHQNHYHQNHYHQNHYHQNHYQQQQQSCNQPVCIFHQHR